MIEPRSFEILRTHLEKKKSRNKAFSLRGLAKRLDISSAFLSKILSGKKALPLARARAIAKALELDSIELRKLERAVFREQKLGEATKENLEFEIDAAPSLGRLPSEKYEAENSSASTALDEWYYIPILDLVTCRGFQPSWIVERLGLRQEIADRAWTQLQSSGWVTQENGRWQKRAKKFAFPPTKLIPAFPAITAECSRRQWMS